MQRQQRLRVGALRCGSCQPSCSDGILNGSEVALDSGASFEAGCPKQFTGEVCRYDDDCVGAAGCEGEGTCVLSADCPVNDAQVACLDDADCAGGGTCLIMSGLCQSSFCSIDAECPNTFCQLPEGRCACEQSIECNGFDNLCEPSRSMCLSQCSDGRCLGTCGQSIGIGN
ncbi:MAG: hypothetical protein R3C68_18215 [Myxococcota bacterium]